MHQQKSPPYVSNHWRGEVEFEALECVLIDNRDLSAKEVFYLKRDLYGLENMS